MPLLAVGHPSATVEEGNLFQAGESWGPFSPMRPQHQPDMFRSYPTAPLMPSQAFPRSAATWQAGNIPAGEHSGHSSLTQPQRQPGMFRSPRPAPLTPQSDSDSASPLSSSGSGSGSKQRRRPSRHDFQSQSSFASPISFPPLGGSTPIYRSVSPDSSRSSPPILAYGAAANQLSEAERMKWQDKMLDFLNREDCRSYREQVPTLGVKLRVDFKDILMKDEELGLKLCRTQGSNDFWLQPAANKFFKDNGVKAGLTGSFEFVGMPARLRPAREVLGSKYRSNKKTIFDGKLVVDEATEHGKRTMDAIVSGILDYIEIGLSWDGELKLDHLFIEEDLMDNIKLFISKEPKVQSNAKRGSSQRDLSAVWDEVESFYTLPNGKLPLYFEQLKHDLKNATELLPWFLEYLRYHPAFYSSLPRRNLIEAIQKISIIKKVPSQTDFISIFSRPPMPSDWRKKAKASDVLLPVFDYISPAEKELEKEKLQQAIEKAKAEGRNIPGTLLKLH